MLIVNTDALKKFLITNLSKLCNADPAALTKYVLALLKKKRPETQLRAFLLDQLDVFLQKETAPFVDLLLQALKTKSYIENACDVDISKTDTNVSISKNVPELNVDKESKKSESDSKMKEEAKPEHSSPSSENAHSQSVSPSMSKREKPTDFHLKPRELDSSKTFDELPVSAPSNMFVKRCEDYDLRGYCLKGALCKFDHGIDPILVEDVSSINFNVCPEDLPTFEDSAVSSKSPPPLPTISPPPMPPLPPMLDTSMGHYAEPYNPESPGMGTYFPPMFMPNLPPPPPSSGPGIISNTFKTFHSKPHRNRELIGVPTVNSIPSRDINNGKSEFENSSQDTVLKRKGNFDFSRLGPPKKLAKTSSVLELRKVPKHLNNIARLNSHFAKFGRIVNLEVAYENDPEAALVKFSSPMEASNAYRSSIAIFNNRFIKVFYHKPDKGDSNTNPLTLENNGKKENSEAKIPETPTDYTHTKFASTHIRKGNVSRTVFIPKSSPLSSENHVREVKKVNDKKYLTPLEKQLELLRRKQSLLKCSIDHEKEILDMLLKTKNKKEADFLKKTIESISSKISELKSEIQSESEELKRKLAGKASIAIKSEKELLDAEMDIYREKARVSHTHTESKETALLTQVNELKQKAKSLGLLDGSLPPPTGAKQGKELKKPTHNATRPRQILIGENTVTKEDLLKHFEKFGSVESIEDKKPYKIVTFSSKAEAETAFSQGSKLDDTVLKLIWLHDPQFSIQNADQSTDSSESKPANPEILGDDEEEEDEEDSEARSWRR